MRTSVAVTIGICAFFLVVLRLLIDVAIIKALGREAVEPTQAPAYLRKLRLDRLHLIVQKPRLLWRRFAILPLVTRKNFMAAPTVCRTFTAAPTASDTAAPHGPSLAAILGELNRGAVSRPTLNAAELADAAEVISGLLQWPVPTHNRVAVFSLSPGVWGSIPSIFATWSQASLVVVFYQWGIGEAFLPWAHACAPSLVAGLKKHALSIVVVIPTVARMTPDLALVLGSAQSDRHRAAVSDELRLRTGRRSVVRNMAAGVLLVSGLAESDVQELGKLDRRVGRLLHVN